MYGDAWKQAYGWFPRLAALEGGVFFDGPSHYLPDLLPEEVRAEVEEYASLAAELMARGMVAVPAGDNVLRLLPPLIIEQRHVDEAIGTLQEVFQDFAGREAAQ